MAEEEILDIYCNPDKPVRVTFDRITSAAYRIKSGVVFTECTKSDHLTKLLGMGIYIKKEFLQATGSFKERGARYAMTMMTPELKKNGIVAASAGNHAQACCYHGKQLGLPVTVVMPETAPIMKIQKCKNYGGNVIVKGKNLKESKRIAQAYARDNGMMYLNGYDHPDILAGQGTIGLEVWEQVPKLEAVIVPCGGGGMLAGICVAIKGLDSNIKVIAVEPARAACLKAAMKAGKPVDIQVESTLADGLAVGKIGINSFESVRQILDKYVTVDEEHIAVSILKLLEFEKCVVEGAGATGLAAILQNTVPELKGKNVCLILSGGNIDSTVLGRVLDRGLAADGRLVKVKVCIADRPGGIEDLVQTVGGLGVHIKDILHERAWLVQDVFTVEVKIVAECRDREHGILLRDKLIEKYGGVVFNGTEYDNQGNGTERVNGSARKDEIQLSDPNKADENKTREETKMSDTNKETDKNKPSGPNQSTENTRRGEDELSDPSKPTDENELSERNIEIDKANLSDSSRPADQNKIPGETKLSDPNQTTDKNTVLGENELSDTIKPAGENKTPGEDKPSDPNKPVDGNKLPGENKLSDPNTSTDENRLSDTNKPAGENKTPEENKVSDPNKSTDEKKPVDQSRPCYNLPENCLCRPR